MSSIVQGMNAERTNRWLLIGAAVLAVVAGALVFLLLGNVGGDDDGSSPGGGPAGNNRTLVAREDIPAGTTLSSDMFEVREYDDATLVTNHVQDVASVEGRVISTEILKGNQLSQNYLSGGTGAEELEEQLPFLFEKGLRAIGLSTSHVKIVGGHVRPGDFVDVIYTSRFKENPNSEVKLQRLEYLFQDIEVLARTTEPVDGVVVLDANGAPIEDLTADDKNIGRRNTDVKPGDDAGVMVLKLRPDQALQLMSAVDLGEITLSLRPYGDHDTPAIPPIIQPVFE